MKKFLSIFSLLIIVIVFITAIHASSSSHLVLENQFWNSLSANPDIEIYDVSNNSNRFTAHNKYVTCAAIKNYNVYILEEYNTDLDSNEAITKILKDYKRQEADIQTIKYAGYKGYQIIGKHNEGNVYFQVGQYLITALGNTDDVDEMTLELQQIISCTNMAPNESPNIITLTNTQKDVKKRGNLR